MVYERKVTLTETLSDEEARKALKTRLSAEDKVFSTRSALRSLTAEFEELERQVETARSSQESLEAQKTGGDKRGFVDGRAWPWRRSACRSPRTRSRPTGSTCTPKGCTG